MDLPEFTTTAKLVEILRYGDEKVRHLFGVFTDMTDEEIIEMMKNYNQYRGGKYPSIIVYDIHLNSEEEGFKCTRVRVDF